MADGGLDAVTEVFISDTRPYVSGLADATAAAREFTRAALEAQAASRIPFGSGGGGDFARMAASLDSIQVYSHQAAAALEDVNLALRDNAAAAHDDAAAIADAVGAARAGAAGFGLLGAALGALRAIHIPLFGGAAGLPAWMASLYGMLPGWLAAASGMHLLTEAIVETTAVLVPAAIAFTAFGVAAVPTVMSIVTQMKNLNTVNQATGASLYPLTGGFQKLAASVQPQVYMLFGDALEIAGRKSSGFATLASQAGTVVDQLASRFTLMVTHGKGFSAFLAHAAGDLSGIGTVIGNIGGIFGNFMKVVPGYAEDLLHLTADVTHLAESFTGLGAVQWVAKQFLDWHGAIFYVGLAATALSATMRGGLTLLGNWAERAGTALLATDRFGAAGLRAGDAMLGFSASAAGAAALPWGWIALAAAAVGFLAYTMATGKSAAQEWVAGLQAAIGAESAGSEALATLAAAQAQVATRLAAARQLLATPQLTHETIYGQQAGPSLGDLSALAAYSAEQKQLTNQTALYEYRLGRLGAIFGSTTAAQALLTAAGVKMSQMLDKTQWAEILQQVQAVALAYEAMGQRSGALGADLNALTIAGSSQVSAMTKLNQAWSATIGIVSGGQGAFIGFQQDMLSVNQAFTQTGGTGRTVTTTFAAAAAAAQAAGASMNGLNAPSLQLRSTWQAAYQGGASLISALRLMSSASPGGFPAITPAVRDIIAQLAQFGSKSAATRAELVSLAQEVKPGITNFHELTAWLGHTRDAAGALNKILADAGVNLQDVAKDAAALSSVMQSQVTSMFSVAKLKADGVNQALSDLTNAMKTNASTSPVVQAAALTLYDDLRKAGMGAQQTASLVTGLTGVILKVPKGASTTFSTPGLSAAMSQLQSYLALLSQAQGFAQSQVSGGVGVLKNSPPGAAPLPAQAGRAPAFVPGGAGAGGAVHVHVPVTIIGGAGPGQPQQGAASPQYLQGLQREVQEAVLRYARLNPSNGLAVAGGWG